MMSPNPIFAYLACVAAAALPQPDFTLSECRVPKGYAQAMRSEHSEYWIEAIEREWTGIMANDTLDFVPRHSMPHGANLMNSHFVFDVKPLPSGQIDKFKARLVADGNTQKQGVDFDLVFATVVKLSSIRILLALAARYGWRLWQLDVKQAFLQADLHESLYMRMPPHLPDRDGSGNQLVCRLKKSLYGLKQAAREWAQVLKDRLLEYGFQQSRIDTCVYRFDGRGTDDLLFCLVYVDDLIISYASESSRKRFISYITNALPIDDRGELQWVLRMEVTRDAESAIVLSQRQYALKLAEKYNPEYTSAAPPSSPMDETVDLAEADRPQFESTAYAAMADRRALYMSAVGALLWLSAGTRPDIAYATSALARYCSNPGTAHMRALFRCVAYVGHTAGRVLRFITDPTTHIDVYSDASWAAQNSVSGGIVLFLGCPVAWWTRRQTSVSSSTAQAEYFAAALASREGVYIRDLTEDMGYGPKRPTPLWLDSKAAIDLATDPVAFKKTKHIMRSAYELRERVARRIYEPAFVPSGSQLADILTKAMRPAEHARLVDELLHTHDPEDSGWQITMPRRSPRATTTKAACIRPLLALTMLMSPLTRAMPPSPPDRPEPRGDNELPPYFALPPPVHEANGPSTDGEQRPATPEVPRHTEALRATDDPSWPLPCSPHDWRECRVCHGMRCARCLLDTEYVNNPFAPCRCAPDVYCPSSPDDRRPSDARPYPTNPCHSRRAIRGIHDWRTCPSCDKLRCLNCLSTPVRSKKPTRCSCTPHVFRQHFPLDPCPDEHEDEPIRAQSAAYDLPTKDLPPTLSATETTGLPPVMSAADVQSGWLAAGARVRVAGLRERSDLNGVYATVIAFERPEVHSRPRYRVRLASTNKEVYLKPKHLVDAPEAITQAYKARRLADAPEPTSPRNTS